MNPNELERIYNQVAIKISNGDIKSPRQVFDNLKSLYVPDKKFIQDFTYLTISTKGRKKKLARYIIWKLEFDADTSNKPIDEDGFSIEHILPESPSDIWRDNFSDDEIKEMVYRIGNLTPLEPKLNRQISNEVYAIKREAYEKSSYALTRNLSAEDWTSDTIVNRQTRLSRRAAYIWKADFTT